MNLGSNIKEGWLLKYSVSAPAPLKNWRKRYVVIMPKLIAWCDKPGQGAQESKVFPLEQGTTVAVNKGSELTVRSPQGTELKLRTIEGVVEDWHKAIMSAINPTDSSEIVPESPVDSVRGSLCAAPLTLLPCFPASAEWHESTSP